MGRGLMGEACPAAGDDCTDGECHGRILVGEHLAACRACARGQELMGTVVWRPQQQPTEEGTMGKRKAKCTHPQCTNPGTRDVVARGLCGSCYARYRRGDLDLKAGTGGAPETPEVQAVAVAESATPETGEPSDRPDDPDLPDDGYAPQVAAVVETLPPEGQLVGDEDHAPGACQGWPETAEASSYPPVPEEPGVTPSFEVAGLRFEAVDLSAPPVRGVPAVRFSATGMSVTAAAVRLFHLESARAFRVYRAPGALGVEFLLSREGTGALSLTLAKKEQRASMLSHTSPRPARVFPALVGRALRLEATERPGFFVARLPEEQGVAA